MVDLQIEDYNSFWGKAIVPGLLKQIFCIEKKYIFFCTFGSHHFVWHVVFYTWKYSSGSKSVFSRNKRNFFLEIYFESAQKNITVCLNSKYLIGGKYTKLSRKIVLGFHSFFLIFWYFKKSFAPKVLLTFQEKYTFILAKIWTPKSHVWKTMVVPKWISAIPLQVVLHMEVQMCCWKFHWRNAAFSGQEWLSFLGCILVFWKCAQLTFEIKALKKKSKVHH